MSAHRPLVPRLPDYDLGGLLSSLKKHLLEQMFLTFILGKEP